MTAFRIRHLIEEKSVREGRDITMAELSSATGISLADIKRLSDGSSYVPTSEVLDKLKTYFACSNDELIDETTKYKFNLASAFPSEDDLSTDIICLLSAANDITFLQGIYLHSKACDRAEEKQRSEQTFTLMLAVGYLREGMKVFRRLLGSAGVNEILNKIDADSERAFKSPKQESDGEDSLYVTCLMGLRNDAIFHYHKEPYFDALCSIKQTEGHFLVGRTPAETRFLVSDDIRSEIFRSYVDFDDGGQNAKEKMGRIFDMMGNFMRFAHGFLVAYLDHRQVEYEEVL